MNLIRTFTERGSSGVSRVNMRQFAGSVASFYNIDASAAADAIDSALGASRSAYNDSYEGTYSSTIHSARTRILLIIIS